MSENVDYEKLTRELEEIVAKLQDDATSIDEALKLYEKGKEITSKLEEYLKTAKNKLLKIRESGDK